ncbi:hypothetical protein [Sphingobacterium sp.]|uniref:hypothetical protein n=1 Tax=Sphingobacterium sp. TaxID=341027 RepID=UPI002FDCF3E7
MDKAEWNKHYDIREVHSGNWDPYEASVWELAIKTNLSTEFAYDKIKIFPTLGKINI